jgi:hypothetical protein
VADVACGTGWSSIAMARTYPKITVDGFDVDPGVAGRYDLVTLFEALHDMAGRWTPCGRPGPCWPRAGRWCSPTSGSRTSSPPRRPTGAYGWSVVSCLPSVMGDPETAATGAVLRPATLAGYAAAAGFGHTETLGVEAEDWRFYRLLP